MISKVIETLFAKTDLERRYNVLAPLLYKILEYSCMHALVSHITGSRERQ
jgi:hypothetical protein